MVHFCIFKDNLKFRIMSGHSKWSTIKRKKGAADSKRSKIFSKLSKEITVAAKQGGPDIDANSRLRLAVQNAKGQNMSKDVIDRAISKADKDTSNFAEMTFEGYGPGGIAIFVECLSDNNNRTVGSVRSIFAKNNGHLGTSGSVAYLFDTKGIFVVPVNKIPDRDMFELEIIDAGAEEIEENDEFFEITSSRTDFNQKYRVFQQDAMEFQRKVQNNGFLSLERAQSEEQRLAKAERDLQELNNRLSNELMREQERINRELRDTLQLFLKSYSVENNYKLVLSNTMGDNVLYSDPQVDITNAVVELLNKRYEVATKK